MYDLTFVSFLDPGDFVEADETIARIETDKVTVDITAPQAGVIKEYMAAEGDTVDVGADFYVLDTDAKAGSAPPKAAPAATPEPAKAAPTPTPSATPSPTPTPAAQAPKVSIQNISDNIIYWRSTNCF